MLRTIAVVSNWIALALFVFRAGMQLTGTPGRFGSEGILPLLAYAAAAASYHLQPRLQLVSSALILNGLAWLLGLMAIVIVLIGGAERFVLVIAAIVIAVLVPSALNAWSLLRIKRELSSRLNLREV
jgi:hypothetical protein